MSEKTEVKDPKTSETEKTTEHRDPVFQLYDKEKMLGISDAFFIVVFSFMSLDFRVPRDEKLNTAVIAMGDILGRLQNEIHLYIITLLNLCACWVITRQNFKTGNGVFDKWAFQMAVIFFASVLILPYSYMLLAVYKKESLPYTFYQAHWVLLAILSLALFLYMWRGFKADSSVLENDKAAYNSVRRKTYIFVVCHLITLLLTFWFRNFWILSIPPMVYFGYGILRDVLHLVPDSKKA
jgi:uncharacterized membrane protein